MPEVFLEGVLKLLSENSFIADDGTKVEYRTAYIQCEASDGSQRVVELNTKADLKEYVDMPAVFRIGLRDARTEKGAFKLSILKVIPAEKTIE